MAGGVGLPAERAVVVSDDGGHSLEARDPCDEFARDESLSRRHFHRVQPRAGRARVRVTGGGDAWQASDGGQLHRDFGLPGLWEAEAVRHRPGEATQPRSASERVRVDERETVDQDFDGVP